nr:nucleotide-binding alpha-beta plait domain-containing protein [Tanacetum cinerariifolium]
DIVIKYMGELWIMLEFKSLESMIKFKECVSVMSWFPQVKDATNEFEVDGRIAWVEVEGVPYRLWTENTFARIADKWGNSIREDFKIIHRGKTYWIRANETQVGFWILLMNSMMKMLTLWMKTVMPKRLEILISIAMEIGYLILYLKTKSW